jgi:hypothetical protein
MRDAGDPPYYALEAGEWVVQVGDWMLEALYCHGQASLCPKLRSVMFDYAEFTFDGLKAFVEGRLRLTLVKDQGSGRKFVPVQVVFVRLNQDRPVFVSRAPVVGAAQTVAECELEEQLCDLGVVACIRFQDS